MTLKAKINGEWLKIPFYYIGDAIHTRFSSAKYAASNVHDALNEVADEIAASINDRLAGILGAAMSRTENTVGYTENHLFFASSDADSPDPSTDLYNYIISLTNQFVAMIPTESFTATIPNKDYEDISYTFLPGRAYVWACTEGVVNPYVVTVDNYVQAFKDEFKEVVEE